MPNKVRLQIRATEDPELWEDVGTGAGGVPVPVSVETFLSGLEIPAYNYASMALSVGDTTETYTFKTGGVGGTTVATVVVVYTDNTRDIFSSVTKT